MRKELAKEEGERKRFKAVYIRIGRKTNYKGYSEETILLKNITEADTGKVMTDHVWFSYTKGFQDAGLLEGSQVEFEARVKQYTKGYVNKRYKIDSKSLDYKLSHPTKIKLVKDSSSITTK